MNTLRSFLFILGVFLLPGLTVSAQEPQGGTIPQLKEQIERLVAVDRDATTPIEVKQLNRTFIKERRIRLRALLQKNLDALRKYLLTVESSLEAAEKQIIQNKIKEIENDLPVLDREVQESSSGELPSGVTASSGVSPSPTSSPQGSRTPPAPNENGDGDGATNAVLPSSASPITTARSNPDGQNPPQTSTSLNATLNARLRAKTRVEQTDNTKQTETPSMSASSTSLVDQSSASDLIGVATNLAGLSATSNSNQQSANSVSVTASAYSLLAALNRVDPLNPVFYDEHRAWRNFSITLGYDDEDQKNGTTQRAKLFGAKYLFINRRDPNLRRNQIHIDTVTSSLERAAAAFGDVSVRIRGYAFSLETVRKNIVLPGFKKFLEKRKLEKELMLERKRNELSAATTAERPNVQKQIATLQDENSRIDNLLQSPQDELLVLGTNNLPTSSWSREEREYQVEFLNEYLGANYREKLGKEAADAIDTFIDRQLNDAELVAFRNLDGDARKAVEHIRRAPQLSLAFLTKQRRVGLNEYMGELIFDYGVANRVNLSLNGSYNYKDSKIIGGDTRGFSFAGQLQFQLNRENLLGKKPFSLDVSTQGNWMTGTRAIYKAQGKVTIPIADGIDFPISVTYANRTELIKEHTVKGQFGFTVDTARLIRAFLFR